MGKDFSFLFVLNLDIGPGGIVSDILEKNVSTNLDNIIALFLRVNYPRDLIAEFSSFLHFPV